VRPALVAVLLLIVLAAFACSAAPHVVWGDAEALCTRDRAACEHRCERDRRTVECDVLKVIWVESHDMAKEDPSGLADIARGLGLACADGNERACRAKEKIAAGLAAQSAAADAHAEGQREVQSRITRVTNDLWQVQALLRDARLRLPLGLSARFDEAARTARAVDRQDPQLDGKLAAIAAVANEARACFEEQQAGRAKKQADAAAAATDAENARRRQKTLVDAVDRCLGDAEPCKKECTATPTSNACYGVAMLLFGGVTVPKDRAKARQLAQATCSAQGVMDCAALTWLNNVEANEKKKQKAEQDLPRLFAQCAENHRKILQLKAARDVNGLKALEPSWSQNLDDVREAIELLTDNEGPRYTQLMLRFEACAKAR
jgi:hypothetical protein